MLERQSKDKKPFAMKGQANKSMDVRARAAIFFSRCFIFLTLRIGNFTSRHLSRWVLDGEVRENINANVII